MAKNRSALRAGILMLVSLGLIIAVVIGVKGLAWIKDPITTHLVAFDLKTNVSGLRVGDEVRIGGAKVGEVRKIMVNLDTAGAPPHVLIAFTMPKKYVVKEGVVLRVDGTLTGTSWLNFENMGTGAPMDSSSQPLVGLPSPTTELLASVGGLAPEVKAILADVRTKTLPGVQGVIDDVRTKTVPKVNDAVDSFKATGDSATALTTDMRASYKPVIDKYHAVADKAIQMMEAIRAVFGDTNTDFRETMANLSKTTASLKEKLPGMLEKVDATLNKLDTAMTKVNTTLSEVHTTVTNAKELSAGAKAVIIGNKSKLDSMVDSMKKAGDNLKAATAEIRRSPWRLLYKPGKGEMANLNLYDSARQFAEGANDLNDSAAALRDALKSGNASEEEIKKLMKQVEERFGQFKEVEQKLWANVKE
jgi:phospholipid/cholesterol/gamma-HCH transport system substrate-binding protein